MSLKKEIENLKFDKRMIDWNISRNLLTQEELKKHLGELPDSSHNLSSIELSEEVAEQDMFSENT
jgi:hypothetical protein